MNALVVYYSETGNTEKVAKAIADGLETEARKVGEGDAEFVVIGSPVHGGKPVEQVIDFIKKTGAKRAAVFCTCAENHGNTLKIMERELRKRKIEVVGKLDIKVGDKPPVEEDLKRATEFGKSLLSRI
ncbi:MAG: flavodoxin [Candidatus Bathyarchaeota archaeon BA1]|nr:MAG: flavodoxin [Candidatus Bathyarchaeota archaeon BA1]